jgi:hypothetical protein
MKISNHTSWNRKFMRRKTNLFVQPSKGFNVCDETELSTARIDVVPTVQIRFFLFFASFTISQAS